MAARERLSELLRAADNRYNGIRKHLRKLFVYDWGLCRTRRQCSSLGTMSHLKVPFELMDSDSGEKRFFERSALDLSRTHARSSLYDSLPAR